MLPDLIILDGQDQEGNQVDSEEEYGEEGEMSLNEDIIGQLDEDTKKRIIGGGMTAEEYEALGLDFIG